MLFSLTEISIHFYNTIRENWRGWVFFSGRRFGTQLKWARAKACSMALPYSNFLSCENPTLPQAWLPRAIRTQLLQHKLVSTLDFCSSVSYCQNEFISIFWVCGHQPQMTLLVHRVWIKCPPQLSSDFSPAVILWLKYINSKSYYSYKTYNF